MRPRRRRNRRNTIALTLCVGSALAISACGSTSSSSSSTTSNSTAASSTTQSTGSGKLTAADIKVVHNYVGGTIGAKATKSPIQVGMVVGNVGATGQPYLATDYRNAMKIVNNDLGGIDGHPIDLVQCDFGATAQQGQICGSQFANDKAIKAVLFGGGTIGSAQLHAANNGAKPYLCTTAGPAEANVANTYCTEAGALAGSAILTYMKEYLHVKSVAIDSVSDPTLDAIVNSQKPLYKAQGIVAKTAFSPAGATDVTSTLVASGATTADAILLELPLTSTCAPYIKSIKSLGITKPVVSLQTCASSSVAAQVGGIPDYTFLSYGQNTDIADPTGQSAVFNDANAEYGSGAGENGPQAFGTGLLLAKIFNELGPNNLSTAAVSAKIKAYTGPAFLGDPILKFGTQPFPSVGTVRARFFTRVNNTWKDATNGKWLSPLS
jgi:branched-chain amino acid transport system substrate-binding protein